MPIPPGPRDALRVLHKEHLREAEATDPRQWVDGHPGLRVANVKVDGTIGSWYMSRQCRYDLRTVHPTEVFIDQGDHLEWLPMREFVHILWSVLDRWNMDYWGSLSAGKGVHTQIIVHPGDVFEVGDDDIERLATGYRRAFVSALLWACKVEYARQRGFDPTWMEGGVEVDRVVVVPNHESRMVREFGASKLNPKTGLKNAKTLWTRGRPYRPLPETREEAYRTAGLVVPSTLPINEQPPGTIHMMLQEAFGGQCPKEVECFEEFCDDCPATR